MIRPLPPLRIAVALFAIGMAGAAASPAALADDHRDSHRDFHGDRDHGYWDRYHHWHPPIFYGAAPVAPYGYGYAPPPVVYAPPPAPVYAPPLVGLGFNINLR